MRTGWQSPNCENTMKIKRILLLALVTILLVQTTSCATFERARQKKSTVLPMLEEYNLENARAEDHSFVDDRPVEAEPASFTIQSQYLYQTPEIQIKAVQAENNWLWGAGIRIEVTNNTDKEYSVYLKSLSVNDQMVDSFFYIFVDPYSTISEVVYLDAEGSGIENVGEVKLAFTIDSGNYLSEEFTTPIAQICTSLYSEMDAGSDKDSAGVVIYYEMGIKIEASYSDDNGNPMVVITMSNTTDRNLTFRCTKFQVNGAFIPETFSCDVTMSNFDTKDIYLAAVQAEMSEPITSITLGFSVEDEEEYEILVSYTEGSLYP